MSVYGLFRAQAPKPLSGSAAGEKHAVPVTNLQPAFDSTRSSAAGSGPLDPRGAGLRQARGRLHKAACLPRGAGAVCFSPAASGCLA